MAIYWILMSAVTAIPAASIYKYSINDKLEHFIAYFILTIFVIFSCAFQRKLALLSRHPFISTLLIIAVYGMLNELAQLYIPDRFCDFYDWTADVAGSILAFFVIYPVFGKAFKMLYNGKIADNIKITRN